MHDPTTPEQLLAAIRAVDGMWRGTRAAHAAGSSFEGTFVAGSAARVLRASVFHQGELPVVVRFSNSSGDPNRRDGTAEVRGIATQFRGVDRWDLIAVSMPAFVCRTPADFLGFLGALQEGAGSERFTRFLRAHPETAAVLATTAGMGPPVSWGTLRYWAVHAFQVDRVDGEQPFWKFRWEPEAGVGYLSGEEADARPARYLAAELAERCSRGPVRFRLMGRPVPDTEDPLDVTVVAGFDGEVELGVCEVRRPVPDNVAAERERFDPTVTPAGIAPGGDPILAARHEAYRMSADERLRG